MSEICPLSRVATTPLRSARWLLAGLWLALPGCETPRRAPEPLRLSGSTMGTSYHLRLTALPPGLTSAELQQQVDQQLELVEQQMSTYREDSELSRFNASRSTDWFPVSADTARVVAVALDISRQTQGRFDVTVGPLVNLWNFGPHAQAGRVPSAADLTQALARVGWQHLASRPAPPALRKARPEIYVDLSAIAKGFAVDQVAELCERLGVSGYMVEIGGEVRTRGQKPDGSPWRIGIERPLAGTREIGRVVELASDSLATSGDYRNFFEQDGHRYCHILDPRTGLPVDYGLTSVSVLAENCMLADALATGLMVMRPDEALRFAAEHHVEVLLIEGADKAYVEHATPGFAAKLRQVEH